MKGDNGETSVRDKSAISPTTQELVLLFRLSSFNVLNTRSEKGESGSVMICKKVLSFDRRACLATGTMGKPQTTEKSANREA